MTVTVIGALTDTLQGFPSEDVNRAYCDGLTELCANNGPETDIGQTVFICMKDQPSTIKLMCAYGNRCMNDVTGNFIIHCCKPCVNSCVGA
ncbi:hypothetical protein DL768_001709 [Monosporascus sp. mg162]|nr:hypothetical protein DL768_001709 [Monosporascus sp. mg162]